MLNYNKLETSR